MLSYGTQFTFHSKLKIAQLSGEFTFVEVQFVFLHHNEFLGIGNATKISVCKSISQSSIKFNVLPGLPKRFCLVPFLFVSQVSFVDYEAEDLSDDNGNDKNQNPE